MTTPKAKKKKNHSSSPVTAPGTPASEEPATPADEALDRLSKIREELEEQEAFDEDR